MVSRYGGWLCSLNQEILSTRGLPVSRVTETLISVPVKWPTADSEEGMRCLEWSPESSERAPHSSRLWAPALPASPRSPNSRQTLMGAEGSSSLLSLRSSHSLPRALSEKRAGGQSVVWDALPLTKRSWVKTPGSLHVPQSNPPGAP